ncbi:MAG: RluA family pseudouridine synthase [Balneolaceae bacterium]|nr:MAG: RluA family pseudouridine synthase [Balneolaceae bacterium]
MKTTGTDPELEIRYEDNHLLAVCKPAGVLSQEDYSGGPDVLTLCKEYLKREYHKPGNVFLGLVHRLDKPVSGVMLLAKTSKAASRISDQIRRRTVEKSYLAVVKGSAPPEGKLIHYLTKDPEKNRSHVAGPGDKGAKKAELSYQTLMRSDGYSLVEINLITGRSHQIRVQFSAAGYPLWGDHKYGKAQSGDPALFAYRIRADHPTLDQRLEITATPPHRYPWNLFSTVIQAG